MEAIMNIIKKQIEKIKNSPSKYSRDYSQEYYDEGGEICPKKVVGNIGKHGLFALFFDINPETNSLSLKVYNPKTREYDFPDYYGEQKIEWEREVVVYEPSKEELAMYDELYNVHCEEDYTFWDEFVLQKMLQNFSLIIDFDPSQLWLVDETTDEEHTSHPTVQEVMEWGDMEEQFISYYNKIVGNEKDELFEESLEEFIEELKDNSYFEYNTHNPEFISEVVRTNKSTNGSAWKALVDEGDDYVNYLDIDEKEELLERVLKAHHRHRHTSYDTIDKSGMTDDEVAQLRRNFS